MTADKMKDERYKYNEYGDSSHRIIGSMKSCSYKVRYGNSEKWKDNSIHCLQVSTVSVHNYNYMINTQLWYVKSLQMWSDILPRYACQSDTCVLILHENSKCLSIHFYLNVRYEPTHMHGKIKFHSWQLLRPIKLGPQGQRNPNSFLFMVW